MVYVRTKQGSHSILNGYFQEGRQKEVLSVEWLILNVSPYGQSCKPAHLLNASYQYHTPRKKIIIIAIPINLYMNNVPGEVKGSVT
jgi:hypothetical protein